MQDGCDAIGMSYPDAWICAQFIEGTPNMFWILHLPSLNTWCYQYGCEAPLRDDAMMEEAVACKGRVHRCKTQDVPWGKEQILFIEGNRGHLTYGTLKHTDLEMVPIMLKIRRWIRLLAGISRLNSVLKLQWCNHPDAAIFSQKRIQQWFEYVYWKT